MYKQLTADPTGVNDSAAKAEVGAMYQYKHPTYGWWVLRYCQFKDAVTYAAGQVLTIASADGSAVTNDVAGGSSLGSIPGGVALTAVTQNYYGYALVDGYYPTIKTNGDDDITAANVLLIGAADGVCDSAASTWTAGSFGISTAADVDANNTVAGIVRCL